MPRLGSSDLEVSTLCLGTNVFGWNVDEREAHRVLDAFADAGGNFLDTADVYSAWLPGHEGGESETIIGTWLAGRPERRDEVVVATKVGSLPTRPGLRRETILAAADESLRRLQTDHVDLYWAHKDDPDTPLEETLGAFGELIAAGKVRAIGASNYSAARLTEALEISARDGLPRYEALQPGYNLVERGFEGELRDVVAQAGIATVPYYGLAKGFLTGKYRPGGDAVDSVRAEGAAAYLDHGGVAVLEALDAVAATREVPVAAVALAWLAAQPTVASPIASARTPEQLADLLPVQWLKLTGDELAQLTAASAATAA